MPLKNLKQFNASLDAAVVNNIALAKLVTKKTAMEILSRVVARTPVDTGRARGNWIVTVNSRSYAQLDTTDRRGEGAPPGPEIMQQALAALSNLPMGAEVIIQNNLPYIEVLEEGSSDQAPEGMLAVTLAEMQQGLSITG